MMLSEEHFLDQSGYSTHILYIYANFGNSLFKDQKGYDYEGWEALLLKLVEIKN